MKMKSFAALCYAVLMATVGIADEPKSAACKCAYGDEWKIVAKVYHVK